MDYRTLCCVISVSEEKSFSAAANRLFLSQPSVSHCILKEEKSLGVSLFDRKHKPLRLTRAGERYVCAARQILSIKENLEKDMRDIAQTKHEQVTFGVTKCFSSYLLPHILPLLQKNCPEIRLNLIEDINASLESLLLAGKLDLAVLLMPLGSEQLMWEHLYDETLFLCMPKDHPLTQRYTREGADLQLLKDEPLILYKPEQRMRRATDALLKEAGIEPRTILESETATTILNLVSTGIGCAFLPKSAALSAWEGSNIVSFPIGFAAPISSVFAWRKGHPPCPAACEFMRTTREFFAFSNRVGGLPLTERPSSYTTVRTYPYTAVQ